MARHFSKARNTISEHIQQVFIEGELNEEVVCRDYLKTGQHGEIANKTQEHNVKLYNLDDIISDGYRVKSLQVTQFRNWATKGLKRIYRKRICFK